jgi:hypothetical protein
MTKEFFMEAMAGMNERSKPIARVATYCGIPADARSLNDRVRQTRAVLSVADQLGHDWDFGDVECFYDPGMITGYPGGLGHLKANLLREKITHLICHAPDLTASAESVLGIDDFLKFLEEHRITLHVIPTREKDGTAEDLVGEPTDPSPLVETSRDDQPEVDPEQFCL